MTRIAHVSDPHFGSEEPGLAEALKAHLNAGGYDLVIVSGDLTMAARSREFRAARAFLDGLAPATLSVPGNHDVTPYRLVERFFSPWRRWRSHISPTLEPEWRDGSVAVVGVNTARRALLTLDWSAGSISRAQIRRLAARFAGLPDHVFRIVVAHHPFAADAALDRPTPLVRRAAKALTAFSDGEVDLVVSGHLHRTYTAALEVTDTGEAAGAAAGAGHLPSVEAGGANARGRRLVIVQAGTALSVRTRGEPNAFNRIDIGEDGRLELRRVVWRDGAWRPDEEPMAVLVRPPGPAGRGSQAGTCAAIGPSRAAAR